MKKKKIKEFKEIIEQLWEKQADLMEKMVGDRDFKFPIAEDDMQENYEEE